eukprot:3875899-Prymnesium_polylepis.1
MTPLAARSRPRAACDASLPGAAGCTLHGARSDPHTRLSQSGTQWIRVVVHASRVACALGAAGCVLTAVCARR